MELFSKQKGPRVNFISNKGLKWPIQSQIRLNSPTSHNDMSIFVKRIFFLVFFIFFFLLFSLFSLSLAHWLTTAKSLANFLRDPHHVFIGVGIRKDIEKLLCDYGLNIANVVDLRDLGRKGAGLGGVEECQAEDVGEASLREAD